MPDQQDLSVRVGIEGADVATQAVAGLQTVFTQLIQQLTNFQRILQGSTGEAQKHTSALEAMAAKMVAVTKAQEQRAFTERHLVDLSQQQTGVLGPLIEKLREAHQTYQSAASATQGFGGALGVLSSALSFIKSPLGIATVAVGVLAAGLAKVTSGALGTFRSLRQLSATAGASARDVDIVSKAFELAGVQGETLNTMLFRLNMSIETGGKELRRLGIETTDASGRQRESLEVLLDFRRKVSEGSASIAEMGRVLGRQARIATAAFKMSDEQWLKNMETAAKSSAIDAEFMEKARKAAVEQAKLAHEWEKYRIEIAKTIGLDVGKFFTNVKQHALSALPALVAVVGQFAQMWANITTGGRWWEHLVEGQKEDEEEKAKKAADAAEKQERLREYQARQEEQQVRFEAEMQKRRLAGETAYAAELSKIRTGSNVEALRLQITTNEQEIRNAQKLYDDLIAIKERMGEVLPEEELPIRKQRDEEILRLEQANAKAKLDIARAEAADMKKVIGESLALVKARSAEELEVLQTQKAQEHDLLVESGASRTQMMLAESASAEQFATKRRDIRLRDLNLEKQLLGEQAAKFKDNAQIQEEVARRTIEINKERVAAEEQANRDILASRKKLYDDLRGLAEQEADAGKKLRELAMRRLEKRGIKGATPEQIAAEAMAAGQEAATIIGPGGQRGFQSFEKIREAEATMSAWETWQKAGGASGMSVSPEAAMQRSLTSQWQGMQGFQKPIAPTGAGELPYRMRESDMWKQIAGIWKEAYEPKKVGPDISGAAEKAGELAKSGGAFAVAWENGAKKAEAAVTTMITNVKAKLEALNHEIADSISDAITRRFEFDAPRQ